MPPPPRPDPRAPDLRKSRSSRENLVDRLRIGQQKGRVAPQAERHDAAILGRDAGNESERVARIGREVAEQRYGPGRRFGRRVRWHLATLLRA